MVYNCTMKRTGIGSMLCLCAVSVFAEWARPDLVAKVSSGGLHFAAFGAATLSTGVEIPSEGVPTNNGTEQQYTVRMEKRPAAIADEATYLKWKWRMNLANPDTGLDNDALREA